MDGFAKDLSEWSWEENKLFELALAVVDERNPDRWEAVAAMVGGKKSAEDVQKHYVTLLEDLRCIEAGDFDHALVEDNQDCSVLVGCDRSSGWSDDDHKLLLQLNIN